MPPWCSLAGIPIIGRFIGWYVCISPIRYIGLTYTCDGVNVCFWGPCQWIKPMRDITPSNTEQWFHEPTYTCNTRNTGKYINQLDNEKYPTASTERKGKGKGKNRKGKRTPETETETAAETTQLISYMTHHMSHTCHTYHITYHISHIAL